jgi:hypothetical protein
MDPTKLMQTIYTEETGLTIRQGQVELTWVKVHTYGQHLLIKTYLQTDEEAGGRAESRRAMLGMLEGQSYYHNGVEGIYENVGDCEKAPREFAVRTLLIKSQSEFLDAKGDWDYEELVKRNMHDNLDIVLSPEGVVTDLKPFRKGPQRDGKWLTFEEVSALLEAP